MDYCGLLEREREGRRRDAPRRAADPARAIRVPDAGGTGGTARTEPAAAVGVGLVAVAGGVAAIGWLAHTLGTTRRDAVGVRLAVLPQRTGGAHRSATVAIGLGPIA